jgi:ribosomal protein S13
MKFERVMQIYWSKGIYYNGKLFKNDWTLNNFINEFKGVGKLSRYLIIKKFEITHHLFDRNLIFHQNSSSKNKLLNNYLSYITNTASSWDELLRYHLIRLYLIKTFRGRAQALGKPSRGQRTWSNAWTAFKYNTLLRDFVSEVSKHKKKKSLIPKKKNYKIVSRKIKKPKIKIRQIVKNKVINLWF